MTKDIIKVQMNSQIKGHKGRGLEGSRSRSFCSCGVGVCHPPSMWMHSPTSEPHSLGIFMETSSHSHDWLLTPSPALSLLWRMGDGTESSKLLIRAWSFWGPVPAWSIQEPTQSHSVRPKTLLSPWKFQGIWEPCVTHSYHLYHSGNYKGLGRSVSGMGAETKHTYFLLCHRSFLDFPLDLVVLCINKDITISHIWLSKKYFDSCISV